MLGRLGARITAWAERWIPDAFVFALVGTVVVVAAAVLATPSTIGEVVRLWGKGFSGLLSFTMQMSLIVIAGYVVATTRPVYKLMVRLATVAGSPRGAVAMVSLVAMLTAWLNWGFGLMFSAMLAKEVARRVRGVDYRALGAASFMGLGSVWAQGLSGSAALQMATPSALPQSIRDIIAGGGAVPGGVVPLTDTIFLWQSFVCVSIEIVLVVMLMFLAAPTGGRARTVEELGIDLGRPPEEREDVRPEPARPIDWLEYSPVLNILVGGLGLGYLVHYFATAERMLQAITLDAINLTLLTAGILLHGTPARLMRAVKDATPAIWGIVLQYPFYAAMAAVISETKLSERIAHFFVSLSTPTTFPALIAVYSAALGMFVPSGGGKWVIEAPYVMQAAHDHHVHLGWMVVVYDLGEAVANLVQPFWMLPVLGLFRLRARDVMGYTVLVFLVLTPVVLTLVTLLGRTLAYPL